MHWNMLNISFQCNKFIPSHMNNVEFWEFNLPRGGSKIGMSDFLLVLSLKGKQSCHQWPDEKTNVILNLKNCKDGEFRHFERMKRKKMSRVAVMAEIAAEIILWEGYEVTGPVDKNGSLCCPASDMWKTTRP